MNIYVCIKQVPDTEATLLVKEGVHINESDIKWIMSPYDEYALEEALKLKENYQVQQSRLLQWGPVGRKVR